MSDNFLQMVMDKQWQAKNQSGGVPIVDIQDTSIQQIPIDEKQNPPTSNQSPKAMDESLQVLPEEARKVLVYLLRHGVILATQKAKLFDSLCHHQASIRQYLGQIYLYLVLDERQGVAFVATSSESVDENDDDEENISLIGRRTLTVYDTLILLVLRKYYQEREMAGEQRIVIDIERIEVNLSPFLPLSDHGSLDRKKLSGRLKEFVKRKLLSAVRGTEDRFEITPIIRYVVNAEFLEAMLEQYLALVKNTDGVQHLKDNQGEDDAT